MLDWYLGIEKYLQDDAETPNTNQDTMYSLL